MLAVTTEYRKGILFVRLEGSLVYETISLLEEELNKWLEEGITNVVFNVGSLTVIDALGVTSLLRYYHTISNNKGHSFICGINECIEKYLKKAKVLNYIYEISDELNAIKVMKWNSWS